MTVALRKHRGPLRHSLAFDGTGWMSQAGGRMGALSEALWFLYLGSPGTGTGTAWTISTPGNGLFQLTSTGGVVNLSYGAIGLGVTKGTTPLVAGTWYHGAVVISGNGAGQTQTIYLNGRQDGQASGTIAEAANPLTYGANNSDLAFYTGNLAAIRDWNRVLTPAEISAMARGVAAPRSSLVAEWLVNESSGTSIADSVGGNTGTLHAGATISTVVPRIGR